MKLSECEILPGIVIDVEDPDHIGRVKAMVPTWFDTNVMEKDALPWCYPINMKGYQTFSKLENGRKIWVLHNYENDLEYWYWPMFELDENTKGLVEGYDSPEVLVSRSCGDSGSVYIYYNDTDGIVLSIGKTKVNITTNNEIHITDGTASIEIVGSKINIGKSDNLEQAVMGQKLQTLLTDLGGNLQTLGQKAMPKPYVTAISGDLIDIGSKVQKAAKDILSDTVKISK